MTSETENKSVFTEEETKIIGRVKNDLIDIINANNILGYSAYNGDEGYINIKFTDDIAEHFVVAGGFFSSYFRGEMYKDIDVFILNNGVFGETTLFQNAIWNKQGRWSVKFHLDENDEYSNDHILATAFNTESKVQYIQTDFKTRRELLDHFDYLHCTASFHNGKLYINREIYDSIMNKHLVLNNKKVSIKDWRKTKFHSLGWKTPEEVIHDSVTTSVSDLVNDIYTKHIAPSNPTYDSNPKIGVDLPLTATYANALRKSYDELPDVLDRLLANADAT